MKKISFLVIMAFDRIGNDKNPQEIFGVTIHELAHASHWELAYSSGQYVVDDIFSEPYMPESWAVGVEAVITNDIYGTDDYGTRQTRSVEYMKEHGGYTSLVWDLIDTFNQGQYYYTRPYDLVENYTLEQIEGALPGALGSWNNWKIRLRDLYANPTEEYLDTLFYTIKPN